MSDFNRIFKDGNYILGSSLAEKVLVTCCKMIESKKYLDLVDYYLSHIDNIIDCFPDNIWLKYHKGKLLLIADRNKDAKEFIIPVVREKQSESWAWGLLGNIFLKEDIEKSIACLSKAILVCREENFITNIRLELAKVLIEKKLLSEAKCEIESVINYKIQKGQKLSEDIQNYFNEEWFKSTLGNKDNNELYGKYSDLSNSILLDELPWSNAIITGKDINSERAFLLLENNEKANVKFKLNNEIKDLVDGSPVKVKAGNEIGKITIYTLEKREGENWDLLPTEVGIIDDINYDKSLSHIILNKNKDCILHHDKFDKLKDCPIGSFVKCKTKIIEKENKKKIILLTCELTDETPNSSIYKSFKGYFVDPEKQKHEDDDYFNESSDEEPENALSDSICNSFGFVKSDQTYDSIYVHKSIVQKEQLRHNEKVECNVVYSTKTKMRRGRLITQNGWRAISVEKF